MLETAELVETHWVETLRSAGRARVRRRLEALVNEDILGVAGAQLVYRNVFGGELKAVKEPRPFRFSQLFCRRPGGAR